MKNIKYHKAQACLAITWFVGIAPITIVLIIQSFFTRYDGRSVEVWEWFLPSIMPVTTMIVSVLIVEAQGQPRGGFKIRRLLFNITLGLVIFYCLVLNGLVFAQPVLSELKGSEADFVGILRKSTIFLGPIQGLVSAAFGVFFVSKER